MGQITAHERQALIGHLEGNFDQSNTVLTDKQRLAIFQEQTFRRQGFGAFSPASDNQIQRRISEQPRQNAPAFETQAQQQFGVQQNQPFQSQPQRLPAQQQQQFQPQQEQRFRPRQQQQFQQRPPQQQQFQQRPAQQQQFQQQVPQQQQFQQRPPQQQRFQQGPQQQQQFQQRQQQQFSNTPAPPSRSDLRALQQQEDALNEIIALQNSINFPGGSN